MAVATRDVHIPAVVGMRRRGRADDVQGALQPVDSNGPATKPNLWRHQGTAP